jgi:hypothetical protein
MSDNERAAREQEQGGRTLTDRFGPPMLEDVIETLTFALNDRTRKPGPFSVEMLPDEGQLVLTALLAALSTPVAAAREPDGWVTPKWRQSLENFDNVPLWGRPHNDGLVPVYIGTPPVSQESAQTEALRYHCPNGHAEAGNPCFGQMTVCAARAALAKGGTCANCGRVVNHVRAIDGFCYTCASGAVAPKSCGHEWNCDCVEVGAVAPQEPPLQRRLWMTLSATRNMLAILKDSVPLSTTMAGMVREALLEATATLEAHHAERCAAEAVPEQPSQPFMQTKCDTCGKPYAEHTYLCLPIQPQDAARARQDTLREAAE